MKIKSDLNSFQLDLFCFLDGQRTYSVPGFKASKFKITNGEFLEFVKDNGYARDEVWTADGWKWRSFRNNKWPVFWQRVGPQGLHEYDLRLLYDVVPMAWDFPVSINLHEATAYAKWMTLKSGKEMRVMTELEHHSIRDPMPSTELGFLEDPVLFNSPDQNTNLKNGSQSPVNEFKPNSKGFYDVLGNSWEWTMDYFSALPGFKIHPLYEDFSTPCFDGRHNVIMSGSFISTGDQASYFSRFHFRPHFLQHASFRLVEPNPEAPFVTSDTDAPGPYRGTNYPFRKSLSSPVDSA